MKNLKKSIALLLCLVVAVGLLPVSALAADDYPAKYKNAEYNSIADEWNFFNRQCTSFCAWCLNSRNGVAFHNYYGGVHWGNANNWGNAARSIGISVDNNPRVGSIAWSTSGSYGHVAWVSAVNGGNVTIEEYNYSSRGNYGTRTVAASSFAGFIHLNDSSPTPTPDPTPTPGTQYYLDVNGFDNETIVGDLQGKGHVDVYLNGGLDAADVNDYYKAWSAGMNYVIDQPTPRAGYLFGGVVQGSLTGVITQHTTVVLQFIPAMNHVNIADGDYIIVPAVNGSKAVDVANGSGEAGANIQIWDQNGTNAQTFTFRKTGNYYSIINKGSGHAIDLSGGSPNSGTNIQQYTYHGDTSERWELYDAGNGYVYIHSVLGPFIDLQYADTTNGANIQAFHFNGTDAQKWKLVPVNGGYAGISPMHNLEEYYGTVEGVYVRGWGFDANDTGTNVVMHAYIDGTMYAAIDVNQSRQDVDNVHHSGLNHGYSFTIPNVPAGKHNVALFMVNPKHGSYTDALSQFTVTVKEKKFNYWIDSLNGGNGSIVYKGWVYDENYPSQELEINTYIDGEAGSGATCYKTKANIERKGVDDAYHCGLYHGFYDEITGLSEGDHTVYIYAKNNSNNTQILIAQKVVHVNTPTTPVTSITLDKTSLLLNKGETYTLTANVAPSDATDKTVTWSTSNANVATVADGIVTAIGSGTAVITAQAGDCTAECTVTVKTPLKITKQPQSVTVPSGQTAAVTVEAQGDGLKYQWYIKNVGQSVFSKSSVTSNTYTVKMSASNNGRKIYCVITDKYGNDVSTNIATLSLSAGLTITKQPQSVTVPSGQTASVTVGADGEGLKYQWYVKNVGQSVFGKSSVTSNTYTVKMSAASNGRQVYCVVTDKNGKSVTSNTATLSMNTGLAITKQPQSVTVPSGQTASVTVEAQGEGLKYQWYVKNVGQSVFGKSSVTSNTYTVKMSATSKGRQVYCVVTDKNGKSVTSNTATLSMSAELKITKQPVDVTAAPGATATVTVTATGDGLTYQWYIKNVGQAGFAKSSVTSNTYSVKMSASNDGRQLYCVVKDQYGKSVKSNVVTLHIG